MNKSCVAACLESVRMAVESVSGCSWNECPDQRGITVRMCVEWVSESAWNPHTDSAFEADDADDRARVEVLLNGVASGMTQLRAVIEQPVSLSYSENIYLEIAPASHDERINVCNHDLGWTTVNYTSEGLILDVFANDQSALSPVSSLQLMRDDLSASDDD